MYDLYVSMKPYMFKWTNNELCLLIIFFTLSDKPDSNMSAFIFSSHENFRWLDEIAHFQNHDLSLREKKSAYFSKLSPYGNT